MTIGPRDYVTNESDRPEIAPHSNPLIAVLGLGVFLIAIGIGIVWFALPSSGSAVRTPAPTSAVSREVQKEIEVWASGFKDSLVSFGHWRKRLASGTWTKKFAAVKLREDVTQSQRDALLRLERMRVNGGTTHPELESAIDIGTLWIKHLDEIASALSSGTADDQRRADADTIAFLKSLDRPSEGLVLLKVLAIDALRVAVQVTVAHAVSGLLGGN